KIAARIMAGEKWSVVRGQWSEQLKTLATGRRPLVSVKEAVFPFARFPGVDVILGPEMKSTGEAMGIDTDFARAYAKALMSAGSKLPMEGTVFLSVKE